MVSVWTGRTSALVRPFSFLLLLSPPAVGQPVSAFAGEALEEIVVSASRLVDDSSLRSHRITAGEAVDTLPLLPSDLLRATPGVFLQQTTPGQGIPIVRGLKGSQVLHLVDGFRLNNTFFRNAPNQYLALVPTDSVQSIEVARGPVGTLYGSDAMGGVVHLHTRRPAFDRALQVGGRAGWLSNSEALNVSATVAAGNENHAAVGGIGYTDTGDRRIGGGERVGPSDYESRSAWLRTRHRMGTDGAGGEWGLSAQFAEQPSTPRVDELVPGFGQSEPAASEFYFEPNRRDFLQLTVQPTVNTAWADEALLQVGWQRIVDDRRIREFESELRARENNSSELWGASALLTRQFSPEHSLRYGLDLTRDTVSSTRELEALATGARVDAPARFPDGSRADSLGAFADYRWQPDARTSVELGLRYSRFDIAIEATAFGGESADLDPDDLSARLGLRRALSPQLVLTANVAEGFRAPNIFDLSALGPRPGNRFNVANTDLEPEHIVSYDVGLAGQFEALRWEVSAFYSDYEDQITSVFTGDTTEDGRLIVTSENIASAELYGAEFFAAWSHDSGLRLDALLNWTWGAESQGGETAPANRIPPINGRVSVVGPLGAWELESSLLFAGEQSRLSARDVADPRMNPEGTASWWVLNLRARRPLGERLLLTLGVDNVLDERYREHGSGIDAPGRGLVIEIAAPLGGPGGG